MPLAHVPEQVAPDQHILCSMGRYGNVATDGAGHVRRREFPAFLSLRTVRSVGVPFSASAAGPLPLAVLAMAHSTIHVIHLFRLGRRCGLHGNMLHFLLL